ncbi:hypothetical protein BC828DRAFT_371985 [Blastocladiella britannica]|nr:hypothetical protein BC828DRAFT_371985 [Blastocladiella britannica]
MTSSPFPFMTSSTSSSSLLPTSARHSHHHHSNHHQHNYHQHHGSRAQTSSHYAQKLSALNSLPAVPSTHAIRRHLRVGLLVATLGLLMLLLAPSSSIPSTSETSSTEKPLQMAPSAAEKQGVRSARLAAARRRQDPRFDRLAIAVKSGSAVATDRFTLQYSHSQLHVARNLILLGDATMNNVGGTGINMTDVVTPVVDMLDLRRAISSPAALKQLQEKKNKPKKKLAPGKRKSDNVGWKNDAYKFFPAVKALHEQFPHAEWYVLADDDTFLFLDNLLFALAVHSPDLPHYFGSGNMFRGCDGVEHFGDGPMFAHGGAGIVLSRAAVARVIQHLPRCTIKYSECPVGDVQLALCLRDAGVTFEPIGPLPFMQENPGIKGWVYPTDACLRPISMHHLPAHAWGMLSRAGTRARAAVAASETWNRTSPATHSHLYYASPSSLSSPSGSGHEAISDEESVTVARRIPSSYKSHQPVNMGDVLAEAAVDLVLESGSADLELSIGRPGTAYATDERDSIGHCRAACEIESNCLSWDYHVFSKGAFTPFDPFH